MLKCAEPTETRVLKLEDFRVLCAWCGTEIRKPLSRAVTPPPESHGICVPCAVRLGMPAERYVVA